MKKKIYLAISFACFMAMVTSIPYFNEISYFKITNYANEYNKNGHEGISLKIANSVYTETLDSVKFHKDINSLAVQLNVAIIKLDMSDAFNNRVNTTKLFISTNDIYAEKSILIESGKVDKIDINQKYTSYTHKTGSRIALYDRNSIVEVTSIENDSKNSGNYLVFSLSKNNRNTDLFVSQLCEKYDGLNIEVSKNHSISNLHSQVNLFSILNKNILFESALCIFLGIIAYISIFEYNKFIAISKVEGESTFQIYMKIILKNILICFAVATCILTLIISLYLGFNSTALFVFIMIFCYQLLKFMILIMLMTFIPYIYIKNCDICKYLRGYSKQSDVFTVLFYFKMVIYLTTIPLIIPAFTSINFLVQSNLSSNQLLNNFSNLYEFQTLKNSTYYDDMGDMSFIALRNELRYNNGLFRIEKQRYFDSDGLDMSSEGLFYLVDKGFREKVIGIETEIPENTYEILIRLDKKSYDYEKYLIRKFGEMAESHKKIIVTYYEGNVMSIDFEDILRSSLIITSPLIYTNETAGYEGQLTNSMFYFNGELPEAKQYIFELFNKYGYGESFNIGSVSERYLANLEFSNRTHISNIFEFLFLISICILSNWYLFCIDFEINEKIYNTRRIEGVAQITFIEYSYKFLLAAAFAVLLSILTEQTNIDIHLIIPIIILFCIECIMYNIYKWLILFKTK